MCDVLLMCCVCCDAAMRVLHVVDTIRYLECVVWIVRCVVVYVCVVKS